MNLGLPWWDIVVRSIVIYAAFVVLVRVLGKRAVGQFTIFDLIFLLLVSNALQPAITGPDDSVPGGILIMVTLTILNFGVAFVTARVPAMHRIIEGSPRPLVRDGTWDPVALRRHLLSREDVDMAMRQQGYDDTSELSAAYLENDGRISIIAKSHDQDKRT